MSRATLILKTDIDRQKALRWIAGVPAGTRVEFKAPRRSLDQNAKLWASLSDVASQKTHCGRKYDTGIWKLLFMHAMGQEVQFVPALDGSTFIPCNGRSSEMTVAEMIDLIEFIQSWGASNGVVFHEPRDSQTEAAA